MKVCQFEKSGIDLNIIAELARIACLSLIGMTYSFLSFASYEINFIVYLADR